VSDEQYEGWLVQMISLLRATANEARKLEFDVTSFFVMVLFNILNEYCCFLKPTSHCARKLVEQNRLNILNILFICPYKTEGCSPGI